MYERYASFNRYGDLSKFITDPDLLQVTGDECIYISNANDYDIAVDLETCYASFDEVKPFIAFLATQIYELDNAAQRFHRKKRVKNSQLEVVFEYKENKFFLWTYGAIDNIPDNWEDEQLIMGYGG